MYFFTFFSCFSAMFYGICARFVSTAQTLNKTQCFIRELRSKVTTLCTYNHNLHSTMSLMTPKRDNDFSPFIKSASSSSCCSPSSYSLFFGCAWRKEFHFSWRDKRTYSTNAAECVCVHFYPKHKRFTYNFNWNKIIIKKMLFVNKFSLFFFVLYIYVMYYYDDSGKRSLELFPPSTER